MRKTFDNLTIANLTGAVFIVLAERYNSGIFFYISLLPAILSIIYFIQSLTIYCKASKKARLNFIGNMILRYCIFGIALSLYISYAIGNFEQIL